MFTHLAWHCSRDISALFTSVIIEDYEGSQIPDILDYYQNRIKIFDNEFFTYTAFFFDFPDDFFEEMYFVNNIIYEEMQAA